MDFSELSRGDVKNFCCDQAISLDCDLVRLLQPERNVLDQYRDVLVAHSQIILQKIVER